MFIYSTDRARLRRHFQKDPVLFSYHIGDLDDFYFPHCQWAVVYEEQRARIEETILIYIGCETPTVMAFGLTERFAPFLNEIVEILPPKFYCHFMVDSRATFGRHYRETPLGTHLKMKLIDAVDFAPSPNDSNVRRLDPSHESELKQLYDRAYPGHYFTARMLEAGKYFGYIEDHRIVAVAGVHVDSDQYKIAVLGNITTDPEYRGRGLGRIVTTRLVSELAHEGKLVCLNVKADNDHAIRLYERLGFTKIHEYEEALFESS